MIELTVIESALLIAIVGGIFLYGLGWIISRIEKAKLDKELEGVKK
jgi:hypothetical protein